jgi:hypothetical protein
VDCAHGGHGKNQGRATCFEDGFYFVGHVNSPSKLMDAIGADSAE